MEPQNYNTDDLNREEPKRLARLDGALYYECELGPVYMVMEGRLHDTWRADLGMSHTGTALVEAVPAEAQRFEIGEGPSGHRVDLDPGLLVSELGPLEEAIEQWATWCDDHAAGRGKAPPSGPRIKVPRRRKGEEPQQASFAA